MLVLKRDIIEKIQKNPQLFGRVAEELDTTVSYGLKLLKDNNPKLTQAGVLRILKEALNVTDDNDILEELEVVPETGNKNNVSAPIMQE